MVSEMASEDRPSHQEQAMALDDGISNHDENNSTIGNPVAPPSEVARSLTEAEPQLPLSTPPTAQTEPSEETSNAVPARDELDDATDSSYHLKWIPWNSGMIPIVMQSMNGPCPLIATMNVLLLREKVKLPNMLEQITESQLLAYIGECIMDSVPADAQNDENMLLNLEQNIHDAIEILPKLKSGLDVNIRFTGITDFEYTPECIIFDLLRIPLYHGWLSDPDLFELQQAIGTQSYNQLVDNIITNKTSQDPVISTRVLLAEEFLDRTASQLTVHGLNELKSKIKDNEIGILFRNNHFLTLFKRDGEIYTLVTDHGYLTEDNIVWETLDSVEGAGRFFDCNFQLSETTNRQVSELKAIDQRQQQMVNDYLVALSLNREETKNAANPDDALSKQLELDSLEVARKLQAEEDAYYERMIREQQTSEDNGGRQLAIVERRENNERDSSNLATSPHSGTLGVASSQEPMSGHISNRVPAPPQAPCAIQQQNQPSKPSYAETVTQGQGTSVSDSAHQPSHHQTQHQSNNEFGMGSASGVQSQNDGSQNRHSAGRSNRPKSERSTKESNCVVH